MNNIVDAVNQNSTNAIQAAVLARLFGGAQANPVIGGVNQAEPPAQDFVSNAMNNPKPTVMPQLAGARGEISGRGGAMGGIGDALMNMYNSRIARSENEVKFAQEAEQAKKQEEAAVKRFAAEQGIKLKTEKEVLAYKEGLASSVAETRRTKAQTANILSEMARRDKTPIKGIGGSGSSQSILPATDAESVNVPYSQEQLENMRNLAEKARLTTRNPKEAKALDDKIKYLNKAIEGSGKNLDKLYEQQAVYLDKAAAAGEGTPQYNVYSKLAQRTADKINRINNSGRANTPPAQPQTQTETQPSVSDLLKKAETLGKPQQTEQTTVPASQPQAQTISTGNVVDPVAAAMKAKMNAEPLSQNLGSSENVQMNPEVDRLIEALGVAKRNGYYKPGMEQMTADQIYALMSGR